ncbi:MULTISPECIES: YchJ family protein [Aliiglaciecola]|uniref:YchJ family protein n=1 Tax=Aliiglaciecola TaxID=1406885 RepID=UPI0026E21FB4|nr:MULTISPECIES: YchJ family protein [unclassified Aliiglaciecola]MDO6710486.1 YchJ family protein [Aliiglaciecola sp. 2_MG-2023]MDO6751649.1 YchJ family protein [Aliiglaciecola sp. 1_MG-2023]
MLNSNHECPCCSGESFENCCRPFISKTKYPDTAEQLMRSRYSAYAKNNYQYILDTYAKASRQNLSIKDLQQSDNETQWLSLEIVNCPSENIVEFKAYSRSDKTFYLLHEVSNFMLENEHWVYVDGEIKDDTGQVQLNRNDQCLCGSGKKYKKCCMG